MMTNLTILVLGMTLGCTVCAEEAPATEPASPAKRIVAVGDLHADLPQTLAVLRLVGVIDAEARWIGGDTTLVQTGDLTDRGPDSLEVIQLLDRLQLQAPAQGGQVISLLGNHETMNLLGDWRYVNPEDVEDFGSVEARAAAFSADGDLGRSLLARDAIAEVGGVIFVHGGVSASVARDAGSTAAIAAQVRAALSGTGPTTILGPEGPLWYRGHLQAPEPIACAELEIVLGLLGAQRMVVGHTTQRSGVVASRCGGRLLGIDTGISSHYGAQLSAVEIIDGDAVAIYPDKRFDLPDP